MELEDGKFDKFRFFLSGVLGLKNTSELTEDKPMEIFTRSFKKLKEEEFSESLKEVVWNDVVKSKNNINDNWKTWKSNFLSILDLLRK